ncbi:metallophosphoesterase [Dyadobacter sandarakinus]|uniref:Metallophosphoesterase n=1 Tax=Dyadobacter sandarakinus TaxID=2747268 RepID=A0ABX7I4Z3_9BACT|nr:metallophosphoesterase [Dyadobacter sandarakinus]QRR01166.1 metallophosphoesterase [Dyadobacter sandarakinus]
MIKFAPLPFSIGQVYLTSDTHYGHKNICSAVSDWDLPERQRCRNFSSIEEMNQAIVDGINNSVGPGDLLIHCGDWSFGGWENIVGFRKKIQCKNIILLQGNHDHQISQQHVRDGYFREFVQIGFYRVEYIRFVCAHYPMSIWHQSHHDVPLFYGHVHSSFENVGKSLDVGIDNIFHINGAYQPVALAQAYEICMSKPTYLESHHQPHTT